MPELHDVSTDDLRDALGLVSEKTPTLRLVAAIGHKNGVTQTELSEWLGVERKTIYNWLDRIEGSEDFIDAVTDEPRPGRPRKLNREELERLAEALRTSPEAAGFEAENWSPTMVKTHIESAFDVEYSLPSCRRLPNELA